MKYDYDSRVLDDGIEEVYAFDTEVENAEKFVVYKINSQNKEIHFFPKPDDQSFANLDKFIIRGFTNVPDEFNKTGYIKGIGYYLSKKLEEINVKVFYLDRNKKSSVRNYNGKIHLTLNYTDFKRLKSFFNYVDQSSKAEKNNFIDKFFNDLFPQKFNFADDSFKIQAKKIINYLEPGIIKYFEPDDTRKLMDFIEVYLKDKYVSKNSKNGLISETKIRVDNVAIKNIIDEFESNLTKNMSEAEWGNFIKKYLFLLDSRYVRSIPQLNLSLGGTRPVDFGLIDFKGHLDILEIKKPETRILSAQTDRGNYYWSSDATKAIVQAEKYLQRANQKSAQLTVDTKREKDFDLKVISPKAILLMGHNRQLSNDKQKEDFQVLRNSFKNIEIVTYDEMLIRLKYLETKFKSSVSD